MYISARERQILETLLSKSDGVTVKELAKTIDVSERTIHRDLKGVEDILADFELTLIKKSGFGIQIVGNPDQSKKLHLFLYNLSHNEYTPDERQTMIMCALLEATEPLKLISLANELNVTIATVSNDLTKLEERFQGFQLSLIRKRGYGVEICGNESAKRRAMSSIISQNVKEVELLALVKETIQKKSTHQAYSASERLLGLVEKKKLLMVEKVIEEINNELPYSIADSAYIGLVVHLSLAIERIIQGENIQIDQGYLDRLKQTIEYEIAEKMIEKLEKLFNLEIPDAEIGYITMHLRGAKLRYDKEYVFENTSFNIAIKAKSLIDFIESHLDKGLSSNLSLFQGLVAHLRPAIYRINENMGISNPLLEKIKADYTELFNLVKAGTEHVFVDLVIPEEEVGYLVLHFGSALMGNKEKSNLRLLIICSSGIGTSKLLATKIQQEIPSLTNLQNASLFELKHYNLNDYDLIISTIPSPDLPKDYILISPIPTEEEIAAIRTSINEKQRKSYVSGLADFPNDELLQTASEKTFVSLKNLSDYLQQMINVLENFEVIMLNDCRNINTILVNACNQLFKQGIISDGASVVKQLFEREQLGGLAIPETKLALYHARSEEVLLPCFKIVSLSESLRLKGMDQSSVAVSDILLLLSPQNPSKQTLEVLSYISTLIIESDRSTEIFQSQREKTILGYLTQKFEKFFHEKLKENGSV